jgi:Zn-finger nucleic acid-binding protein
MRCPVCDDVRMREVEKNGIQIDICPNCKGVWLDRGELEKLLEGVREVRREYDAWHESTQRPMPPQEHYGREYPPDRNDPKYRKYKKKRSVFEIFDDLF